ncbi:hypothetical protein BOTBODRAFT_320817 [Botryobasidium botryosum FD-172 SS1]|uniref:Uncharacterized protein n=1 Tax=Botryobasidium botryosum (strain FD-172 SS1) TaxID=930990 RepID=A0A067MZ43_BOTB1|nr:hypothetical protein BOTBODRAFT_320817 [Botryobasidium botryosum FD-172 SS1]
MSAPALQGSASHHYHNFSGPVEKRLPALDEQEKAGQSHGYRLCEGAAQICPHELVSGPTVRTECFAWTSRLVYTCQMKFSCSNGRKETGAGCQRCWFSLFIRLRILPLGSVHRRGSLQSPKRGDSRHLASTQAALLFHADDIKIKYRLRGDPHFSVQG